MKIKEIFSGICLTYGTILLLSFFNLPVVFFIPISVAGFEIGKIASAIILFSIAFFLLKK